MFAWIREILRININTNSNEEKMINAIKKHKLNIVMKILNYDIDVNYVGATGNTALTLAAEKGYLEIVNVLLAHNANINYYNDDQSSGYTALMAAVVNNHLAVVTTLLAHNADVNHVAINGMNALMLAIQNGYLDIINVLLTKNINVHHVNWFGYTALIFSSIKGYLEIVNVLLTHC